MLNRRNKVWSPSGYEYGPVNSLVGKGESIINFNNQTASYVKTGKVGKDTEPSSVRDDDDNVILGNDINWKTGNKFSQEALPHTMQIEQINDMEKKLNKKNSKYDSLYKQTSKINNSQFAMAKQAPMQALSMLADQQKAQHDLEGRRALQRFNIGDDASYLKRRTNPELPLWNNMFEQTAPIELDEVIVTDKSPNKRWFPVQNKFDMSGLKRVPVVPLTNRVDNVEKDDEIINNVVAPKLSTTSKTTKYNSNDVSNISSWQRALPHVLGLGAALNKYGHWKGNPVTYHSTYAANPYLNRALSIMAQNRISPYSAIKEALDAEKRAAYRLNQSGGLTGGQKQKERVAMALGSGQNIANILNTVNEKNAALRNQYAEAAAKYGESTASRMQNANQFDWNDFVAAHGRKTKGIEQSLADIVNQAKDWYSNDFKYNAWKDTTRMYKQALDQEQQDWIRKYNNAAANNKITTTTPVIKTSIPFSNRFVFTRPNFTPNLSLNTFNYTNPLTLDYYSGHNRGKNRRCKR